MLIGLVLDLLCVSSPVLFINLYCLLASYSLIHILPLQYSLYITNLHIWPFRLGSNDASVWLIEICIAMCFSFFRMQLIWWMWWYFSWGDFGQILIWLTKDRFPLHFGSVLYGGNPMGLLSLGPALWNASYLYLLCKTSRFKMHIAF